MKLLCASVLVVLSASSAFGQSTAPCGTAGQTKIFGCMDTINGEWTGRYATVHVLHQADPVTMHGWVLSCHTAQQPADVQVFYAAPPDAAGRRELVMLPSTAYHVYFRGERPDVGAYFRQYCPGIVKDHWGYALVIDPGALPLGFNVLMVRFTDPTLDVRFRIGVNAQQVQITVVP